MAQRYSEFMTQPQIPGTGPTIQDFLVIDCLEI